MEETTITYPKKYRFRFRYFETGHSCGIKVKLHKKSINRRISCDCSVGYKRIIRNWYRPIMWFGNFLTKYIIKLHNVKKRKLTEKDFIRAKKYANDSVSEKEYLKRFSYINPYVTKPYSIALYWISENIILD